LGAFLTTAIAQAAESRASIPEETRVPFTLYADEFQNFATESFASILSEARKYKLSLVIARQFLGQLPEPLRQAVLGNVDTVLSFRIGAEDAPFIGKELGLHNASTLTDTGNFRAWVKTLYNGVPTDPHHVKMREPEPLRLGRLAAVKSRTAARFGRKRAQVEGRIERFLQR
jgi:TraM recognition site of TraD and TraG